MPLIYFFLHYYFAFTYVNKYIYGSACSSNVHLAVLSTDMLMLHSLVWQECFSSIITLYIHIKTEWLEQQWTVLSALLLHTLITYLILSLQHIRLPGEETHCGSMPEGHLCVPSSCYWILAQVHTGQPARANMGEEESFRARGASESRWYWSHRARPNSETIVDLLKLPIAVPMPATVWMHTNPSHLLWILALDTAPVCWVWFGLVVPQTWTAYSCHCSTQLFQTLWHRKLCWMWRKG